MAKNIKTDEFGQFHEYNVYTPARLINLNGDIDEDTATEFIKNIRLMDHVTEKDIIILINTSGGDVHQGMAIFDAIKECNSRVITHAVGPCWSMGAIIFQAGDIRRMSSNATLMVHLGEVNYPADHPLNVDRWVSEFKRIGELADNILFEKIKKKKPRFKKERFKDLLLFDTILTSTQAIDLGLADEIADHKRYIND